METRAETELVESDLGKSVPELDDSQLVDAAKEGEAVAEGEILTAGSEMEMKCEADGVEGAALKSLLGLDESQLVGVMLLTLDEVVVEEEDIEIPRAGTEMEMGNEVEAIESGEGKFVSELDDSHLGGAESSIAAKEDEDEDAMAEGETGMEDMEMETQTEVANEVGMTYVPNLYNSQNVGAESSIVARDDDDETPVADTEMETETDVAEAEKGVAGEGKRKRGRNSGLLARAPARKAIEEDVCFICFDGGDLVLCDRR